MGGERDDTSDGSDHETVDAAAILDALDECAVRAPPSYREVVSKFGLAGTVAFYDALAARYQHGEGPEYEEAEAQAMCCKGRALFDLGHFEEAVTVYEDVLGTHATDDYAVDSDPVATALFQMGRTLNELHRFEEAIVVQGNLISRIAAATEPAIRRYVGWALLSKAFALREVGRVDEALAAYDEIEVGLGETTEAELHELVARGLFEKGELLHLERRDAEGLEVFRNVAARFGEAPEGSIRIYAVRALFYQADEHRRLRQRRAMMDTAVAIGRYSHDSDDEIRALVRRRAAAGWAPWRKAR